MNYDDWKSTDPTDEEDYRGPCQECGDPCAGIWCDECLARWLAHEVRERHPLKESA